MSAPSSKAKALKTGKIDPMGLAIAGIAGRAAVKLHHLKITVPLYGAAAS